MYEPKSFDTCSVSDCKSPSTKIYQVVIVLIDSLEKGVVNVAVTKHPRLDSLESLGKLDGKLLR